MKTEIDLEKIDLKTGGHRTREEGVCIMEAVAWAAGESHSDFPLCTDRVIARCAQILNDKMPTPRRNELLKPLIFRMIGTNGELPLKLKRAFIAADYAIRVFAPLALEAQGKKELAEKLRALPEIIDRELALKGEALIARNDKCAANAAAAHASAAALTAADAADADAAYAPDAAADAAFSAAAAAHTAAAVADAADADAAYAPDAAAAAAFSAAAAAHTAAAVADAAAADAAIEAHKNKIWNLAAEMLVKMIDAKS